MARVIEASIEQHYGSRLGFLHNPPHEAGPVRQSYICIQELKPAILLLIYTLGADNCMMCVSVLLHQLLSSEEESWSFQTSIKDNAVYELLQMSAIQTPANFKKPTDFKPQNQKVRNEQIRFFFFVSPLAASLPTFQATPSVIYAKINGSEAMSCECPNHACQEVFWYRYLERTKTLQFLVFVNSAGREQYGKNLNGTRFKGSLSGGNRLGYTLRVTGLQEDDIGLYSCMFKTKNTMPVGYYIMPGVNPP
ncbi:uncharacterized protein LOC122326942, partial [Puntigrus tetrazona]|uniref:uncharacterized protein LOC122326942 n=1 Tax=Puntigrus tetrazona TaxID=1606681 RepID=UPI001C8AF5CE